MAMTRYVYRLIGDAGVLYVGMTRSPHARINEHRRGKPWYGQVTTCILTPTPRRALAGLVESCIAAAEEPKFSTAASAVRPCGYCPAGHGREPLVVWTPDAPAGSVAALLGSIFNVPSFQLPRVGWSLIAGPSRSDKAVGALFGLVSQGRTAGGAPLDRRYYFNGEKAPGHCKVPTWDAVDA